ncbi:MAG: ABC transporter ATP-binding protein [Hyphomicrobiales bacterium]
MDVRSLEKRYPVVTGLRSLFSPDRNNFVHAVDGIDFQVDEGEVLGLVGESGCGKSTTAKLLVGLETPSGGTISLDGEDLADLHRRDRRAFYRRVQMIFQDPYGSINPSHDVFKIVSRPLVYQGVTDPGELASRVHAAMERVGLSPPEVYLTKHPHLLSGGQRQRLCIARAIILGPSFLVADEPISMLDVSIKWDIIRLLRRLVVENRLSMVYITHDLATVATICHRLAIMYLGRIVEIGPVEQILRRPRHPYTKALIASVPSPDPHQIRPPAEISGAVHDAVHLPAGCRFRDRCPIGDETCARLDPSLRAIDGREAACHKADETTAAAPVRVETGAAP